MTKENHNDIRMKENKSRMKGGRGEGEDII